METLITTAEAILILIGIAAIGFFVVARKIIPVDALKTLSTLAIEVAVPLYIFSNIIDKFDPASSPDWWKLPLWWIAFAVVTFALSLIFARLFNKSIRKETAVSLYLYNPVFVPLAVLIGIYGSDSNYIADLFLFTIFAATFYLNFYKFFFRKKGVFSSRPGSSIGWKKVFNPLIRITLLALLLSLFSVDEYIPDFVIDIARYVGSMAFPLIMFILGAYIYLDMKNSGKIYFLQILKYVAIKNLAFPMIVLGLLYFIRPDFNIALILLLSASAPPISTIPILVARENGNSGIANQFLVGSFLFAILSMPLMIMLLNVMLS